MQWAAVRPIPSSTMLGLASCPGEGRWVRLGTQRQDQCSSTSIISGWVTSWIGPLGEDLRLLSWTKVPKPLALQALACLVLLKLLMFC